jgi:tRNA A37 threonylcarbamoyladenosine dehydratase
VVCVTNINRQVQATYSSVGKSKVSVLKDRLLDISPKAQINAVQKIYNHTSSEDLNLPSFDYVIDAIDSLSNKVELIIRATEAGCKVISAFGASNKLDPSSIKTGSIWNSQGCRLGKLVRKLLRQRGFSNEVTCIYSEENIPPQKNDLGCGSGTCVCPQITTTNEGIEIPAHEWCSSKKQINGSAVHITAIYGFIMAGLIIQEIAGKSDYDDDPVSDCRDKVTDLAKS